MLDLAHFLHFLAFTLGVVAMFVVYDIGKETGVRYIWSYIVVLLCINLISAAHSYESFIKIKSSLAVTTVNLDWYLDPLTVILSAIRILLAYKFLYFVWRLTGDRWRQLYSYLFIGLILINAVMQTVVITYPVHNAELYLSVSVVMCHVLLFSAFLLGTVKVYLYAKRTHEEHVTRWLHAFSWFWFTYNLFIFVVRISGYNHVLTLDAQLLIFGIVTLLLNSLHIVFSNRLFTEFREVNAKAAPRNVDLFRKYNISKREEGVILLVCEGKTNREIAEALFIAPTTVRDHTSNIYRKTNVKNRTQLASLFNSANR